MKKSTLFLNHLSQIDYAYLDVYNSFAPIGGSYHLNVNVTGTIEEREQVIVDFGKIKKTIKELVDHRIMGYDHKLWIHENDKIRIERFPDDILNIEYNMYKIICPSNAVRFIRYNIKLYLEEELEKIYNKKLEVKVSLTDDFVLTGSKSSNLFEFRYVHGLKNSSSWGCQNLNHGHRSFIGVIGEDGDYLSIPSDLYGMMSKKMRTCIFVHRENLLSWDGNGVRVGYECERGYFETIYPSSANIIITENETTIENLVEWFADLYKDELKRMKDDEGARVLQVSEGLTKGASILL